MNSTVLYSLENKIATITLNRPEKRNAISRELLSKLMSLINQVSVDSEIRALLLRGEGSVFCAGADLKEREGMSEAEVHSFLDSIGKCFLSLENLSCPTIAALDGDAFGGGLELALSCDFIILKKNVRVGLTETGLGIIPGAGGTQRLPRRIGTYRAMEMILSGKTIDAETGYTYGLANSVSDSSAYEDAKSFAGILSEKAPIAVRLAKGAIRKGIGLEMEEALQVERAHYNQTLDTDDRKEALLAFKEKRKPNFKGR
ncbi:enoyl-CoA hydratase [Leptospira fletcheri]|uniref:Enoyl-CoA hydratase n=1 Tax=Leptospira fletcheri TaxID=2484981 RepID=A0A4R9GGE2_9LEPT|nr:enoyl-CoA hydratase-related protein [Leptospira fletcheri]TGK11687.1 enoyl-CoA hydratase [Leptospira fletcheri]